MSKRPEWADDYDMQIVNATLYVAPKKTKRGRDMSGDPAVLFYTSDFIAKTTLMSHEEVGIYIRLLCHQHMSGHMTKEYMERVAGGEIPELVMGCFRRDRNALFFNPRMDGEIAKRKSYVSSRRSNRTKSKNLTKKTHVNHMSNICRTYVEHMGNGNGNGNMCIKKGEYEGEKRMNSDKAEAVEKLKARYQYLKKTRGWTPSKILEIIRGEWPSYNYSSMPDFEARAPVGVIFALIKLLGRYTIGRKHTDAL